MPISRYESIKAGLEEAIAYMDGQDNGAIVSQIESVNVKSLRLDMGMTQADFATTIGVSVQSVRAWEQDTDPRHPTGATQKLLKLMQRHPEFVQELRGL